jgi:hypothetical protein
MFILSFPLHRLEVPANCVWVIHGISKDQWSTCSRVELCRSRRSQHWSRCSILDLQIDSIYKQVLETYKRVPLPFFSVLACAVCTFRISSSSLDTWEHSGNIQETFREHSGNIQGTFRESWADAREPPSPLQEALKKRTKVIRRIQLANMST